MQKRGEIITSENFTPLAGTYPQHPISTVSPKATDFADLRKQRKQATLDDIQRNTQAFMVKSLVGRPAAHRVPDENYVQSPKFTSIKQKEALNKRNARIKANLTQVSEDPKARFGEIGLSYVRDPSNRTFSDIKNKRHDENLADLRKLDKYMGHLLNAE